MWREHEIYTKIRKVSGFEKSEVLSKMIEALAAGALRPVLGASRVEMVAHLPICLLVAN